MTAVQRRIAALAASALVVTAARSISAHQVGISRGEYLFSGDRLLLDITFARGDLVSLAPTLDLDGDGKLSQGELDGGSAAVAAAVVARVAVAAGGAPCAGTLDRTRLTEEDGASVRAVFRCAAAERARVALPFLEDLSFGHRHIARARARDHEIEEVLFRGRDSFEVPLAPSSAIAAFDAVSASPRLAPSARAAASSQGGASELRDARSPILAGAASAARRFEAIAVLTCVALAVSSRAARVVTLAAFVGAAIVGMALSFAGVFEPPARVLLPLLAASVAYAGVDALLARREAHEFAGDARSGASAEAWRPLAAASLGLAHGLGVALGASTGAPVAFALGATAALLVAAAIAAAWAERAHAAVLVSAAIALVGLATLCARLFA